MGILQKLMEKYSPKKRVSILVLSDISQKFWHIYFLIGILSAITVLFQVLGLSMVLSSFNGDFSLPFNLDEILMKKVDELTIIVLSFFILSLSAAMMFFSRKLGIDIMIKYESLCADELIQRVHQQRLNTKDLSDVQIAILLSKDCRYGGRIIQEISNIVMPLGSSIIAFPIMFYLSYETTIVLIAILAITLPIYSRIAAKACLISTSLEQSAAKDSKTKKELISTIRKSKKKKIEIPSLPHPDFRRAYHQRLVMPHFGLLVGGIQLALSLVAISFLFASTGMHISGVILYGFLAVFTLSQLRSFSKVFASFHIFLTYFQRAFIIIKDIDPSLLETIPHGTDAGQVPVMEEEDF